jgi:hypothetical protein
MISALHRDMTEAATKSLDAVLEIARHVGGSVELHDAFDSDLETARAVRSLFNHLAWSDGVLDGFECALLDHLRRSDVGFAHRLAKVIADEPASDPTAIPGLVQRVKRFDRNNHSHLTYTLVGHLEALGAAIISGNSVVLPQEFAALNAYMMPIREYASES